MDMGVEELGLGAPQYNLKVKVGPEGRNGPPDISLGPNISNHIKITTLQRGFPSMCGIFSKIINDMPKNNKNSKDINKMLRDYVKCLQIM